MPKIKLSIGIFSVILLNVNVQAEKKCKINDKMNFKDLEDGCTELEGNVVINQLTLVDDQTLQTKLSSVAKVTGTIAIYNSQLKNLSFFSKLEVVNAIAPYMSEIPSAISIVSNLMAAEFSMPALRSVNIQSGKGLLSTIIIALNPQLCLSEAELFRIYGMLGSVENTTICNPTKVYCGIVYDPKNSTKSYFNCKSLPSGCQILMNPLDMVGEDCVDSLNEKLATIEYVRCCVEVINTQFTNFSMPNLEEIGTDSAAAPFALSIDSNPSLSNVYLPKLRRVNLYSQRTHQNPMISFTNNTNLTLNTELCTNLNMIARAVQFKQSYIGNAKNCYGNETGADLSTVAHYTVKPAGNETPSGKMIWVYGNGSSRESDASRGMESVLVLSMITVLVIMATASL